MSGEKILIVEDERDIADLIAFNLEREGYQVVMADSGEEGLSKARNMAPGLVVLDIMLPGINGLDVCRSLKSELNTRHIPIIILTARDEDVDIVTGLELGADDYVTKPFSPKVLVARVRSILRRKTSGPAEEESSTISVGEIGISLEKHEVTASGKRVNLTRTEFSLLYHLARRPGWVHSRSQLIDVLRDGYQAITDRAIDVQVANLRKKLGTCGDYIETVRGAGYRMKEQP